MKDWMTVREAADYLGVARPTIYRWAREGRLPIYKLAQGVARVRGRDLQAFLEEAQSLYAHGPAYAPDEPQQPGLGEEASRAYGSTDRAGADPGRAVRKASGKGTGMDDPVLRAAGCCSGKPLPPGEIDEELYGGEV